MSFRFKYELRNIVSRLNRLGNISMNHEPICAYLSAKGGTSELINILVYSFFFRLVFRASEKIHKPNDASLLVRSLLRVNVHSVYAKAINMNGMEKEEENFEKIKKKIYIFPKRIYVMCRFQCMTQV